MVRVIVGPLRDLGREFVALALIVSSRCFVIADTVTCLCFVLLGLHVTRFAAADLTARYSDVFLRYSGILVSFYS